MSEVAANAAQTLALNFGTAVRDVPMAQQIWQQLVLLGLDKIGQALDAQAAPADDTATPGGVMVSIGDGTNAIAAGAFCYVLMPFAATVTGWKIVADASGSIVVDVKRSTFAGFPTTVSIAGTEKPTLTAQQTAEDTTLTTWTTALNALDVLHLVVDSASTVKKVSLIITLERA